jgi:hypothetical protein
LFKLFLVDPFSGSYLGYKQTVTEGLCIPAAVAEPIKGLARLVFLLLWSARLVFVFVFLLPWPLVFPALQQQQENVKTRGEAVKQKVGGKVSIERLEPKELQLASLKNETNNKVQLCY